MLGEYDNHQNLLRRVHPGVSRRLGSFPPRFEVRMAENRYDLEAALRLRSQVFNVELGVKRSEFQDSYDTRSKHLIVEHRDTRETVGTYRLNTNETVGSAAYFYSAREFTLENLPGEIINNGVEIGRACISKEYRNTKVLFLLWSGLLRYLEDNKKSYFFGCCSLFTRDEALGAGVYRKLEIEGHLHPDIRVFPRRNAVNANTETSGNPELPPLFNMYLRLGAKVCGPPMIDDEFGTIDFFVLLDVRNMSKKYRRMFSAA